jgi:Fe-S cluster assembly iron-binding protein IscA
MRILTIGESASVKLEELLSRDGHQGFALRLVISGGCSGLRYQSRFDEHAGRLAHESTSSIDLAYRSKSFRDRDLCACRGFLIARLDAR